MSAPRAGRRRNPGKVLPMHERLLAGQPIERTETAWSELVGLFFFGWRDDLPQAAIDAAGAQLDQWRADDEGHAGG